MNTTDTTTRVSWTVDETGYSFPKVAVSDTISWEAYTSVGERTYWTDGHLDDRNGAFIGFLHLVAINAADEFFEFEEFNLTEMRAVAEQAWANNAVFAYQQHGVAVLMVPTAVLSGDSIAEAIGRFRP